MFEASSCTLAVMEYSTVQYSTVQGSCDHRCAIINWYTVNAQAQSLKKPTQRVQLTQIHGRAFGGLGHDDTVHYDDAPSPLLTLRSDNEGGKINLYLGKIRKEHSSLPSPSYATDLSSFSHLGFLLHGTVYIILLLYTLH